MLGKLFSLGAGAPPNSAASSGTGNAAHWHTFASLESVQEDVHTRHLLFPDADTLYSSRNGQVFPLSSSADLPQSLAQHPFDDRGDVDLELRDVRVLLMQDALGSATSASLLYDSHAPAHVQEQQQQQPTTASTTPGGGGGSFGTGNSSDSRRTTPFSPRKGSTGSVRTQTDSPQPRQGPFDRRASLQGGRSSGQAETELQKAAREHREETSSLMGCVFGNSELMAYKGVSTKVHIIPSSGPDPPRSDWRPEWNPIFGGGGDGRASAAAGRARGNRFSQASYASDTVSPMMHAPPPLAPPKHYPDRQRILISRLFPVVLPADDPDSGQIFSPPARQHEDGAGFPFPHTGDDVPKKKTPQPRQKRTPMYALVLVINLPQAPATDALLAPQKSSTGSRGPGSFTEQQASSFPSSYGSTRRSGLSSNCNDLGESAFATDLEARIDALTQHWDIIMRALTTLQTKVTTLLTAMLKCAAIATPDPYCQVPQFVSQRNPSLGPRRPEDAVHVKPPKSNARLIYLQAGCLAQDRYIAHQAEVARNRIVTGLGAARVATGQGRWGMWRDEVRSMVRSKVTKEPETFFNNLLTGFLAIHTDWLLALSPVAYRKRHILRRGARTDDDVALPSRTIIVANDKMMARRLIFLLSAFLPTNQPIPVARAHRPSTAASGPMSNSPPSFIVPLFREELLRKRMNRRGVFRHTRTVSTSASMRAAGGVPATLAHLTMDDVGTHRRITHDPAMVRSLIIPVLASDPNCNKKSAAIATALVTDPLVPHFAPIVRRDDAQRVGQKACTTSATTAAAAATTATSITTTAAADDLKRSLQRGESSISTISQASAESATRSQPQGPIQTSRWGSIISGLWAGTKTSSAVTAPTTAAVAASTTPMKSSTIPTASNTTTAIPPPPPPTTTTTTTTSATTTITITTTTTATSTATASATMTSTTTTSTTMQQLQSDNEATTAPMQPPARRTVADNPPGKLEQMAREVVVPPVVLERPPWVSVAVNVHGGAENMPPGQLDRRAELELTARLLGLDQAPDPTGAYVSAIKTTINEEDGVIDVDVPFPDFMTASETAVSSPSSSGYLSTPGFGGLESFEHAARMTVDGDLPLNVAGWLPRYHPDFALQAIPDQEGLMDAVKSSLRAEPSPSVVQTTGNDPDRWVDVSSAIVANATTNTVTRIRYRRLIRPKTPHERQPVQSGSAALATPLVQNNDNQLEEEFVIETVTMVDDILAEAVDKVTGLNSADMATSQGTLSSQPTDPAPTESMTQSLEVSREQCKTVVLSALEAVIRTTIEAAEREAQAGSSGVVIPPKKESLLPGAVRTWLQGIDMGH